MMERRAGGGSGAGAAETWLAAADGLVAGIHHALNNRLGTVSALAQLVAAGGTPGGDAEHALRREVERLGETLRLLGLVPRRPGEAPVPLQLSALLPDVLALVAQHPDARGVELVLDAAPDVLPVLCPETALAHALLALLVAAAAAARVGGAARVDVRCRGDERSVLLEVEPAGSVGAPPGDAGHAALFAAAGGELEATGAGVVARFPTLAEARRRG